MGGGTADMLGEIEADDAGSKTDGRKFEQGLQRGFRGGDLLWVMSAADPDLLP